MRQGAAAEPSTESLPGMPTEDATITPDPGVPAWLLPEHARASRKRATPERDKEAALLEISGFGGLLDFT